MILLLTTTVGVQCDPLNRQRIVQKGSGAEKVQSGVTGVGNDYLNHRILQSGQLNTDRVFCLKQINGSGNSA